MKLKETKKEAKQDRKVEDSALSLLTFRSNKRRECLPKLTKRFLLYLK